MNIIEKLGIVQIDTSPTHKDGWCFFEYSRVRDIEKQRNEMLEVIIKVSLDPPLDPSVLEYIFEDVIEKDTGKTWEEIKELL